MTEKLDPKNWEGHTPGPWHRGQDGNLRIYAQDGRGQNSGLIAGVVVRPDGSQTPNAHLIAAAPSLAARVEELEAENEMLRMAIMEWHVAGMNQAMSHAGWEEDTTDADEGFEEANTKLHATGERLFGESLFARAALEDK